MKAAAELNMAENQRDAEKLVDLFEKIEHLKVPTIGIARGAVFGGAIGIIACCDIAIADDTAKFCLSEVRLGLLPAVILPYLARKVRLGDLRRYALTARTFNAQKALEIGLVQIVCSPNQLDHVLREELQLLLTAAPEAQGRPKTPPFRGGLR